jgi:hypothetical protein
VLLSVVFPRMLLVLLVRFSLEFHFLLVKPQCSSENRSTLRTKNIDYSSSPTPPPPPPCPSAAFDSCPSTVVRPSFHIIHTTTIQYARHPSMVPMRIPMRSANPHQINEWGERTRLPSQPRLTSTFPWRLDTLSSLPRSTQRCSYRSVRRSLHSLPSPSQALKPTPMHSYH